MQTDYTDQDSERVRQGEYSSAGKQTHYLTNPSIDPPLYNVAKPSPHNNNPIALCLIAVGICMIIGRFLPDPGEIVAGMILFTIASCFLFFSLWKRIYGLLIPGCIIGGLSLGVTFADTTSGASVLWGLAIGFFCIFLLGQVLFSQRNQWPIYPAVILFTIGSIVAIVNAPMLLTGLFIWLPLLLIGVGLYFGWYRPRIS